MSRWLIDEDKKAGHSGWLPEVVHTSEYQYFFSVIHERPLDQQLFPFPVLINK